ncbi:hypothetical protein SAMN04489707_1001135 [Paenacidovorax caeni]|uniref:Uncharacterized protein n=1 Tax=Paenacidovorax caeni TaxID=343013 RepID=A0A1I7F2P4_9BURK|nr:hypothetical protein [Paenacidovorax caeni]SFU30511.1 hypothetical protein SAMN04489707_1001135 [Paenacidovorax caeni]
MTTAWDRWFLMRCPQLWQLRLHGYLPLALLWCLLMFGGWIGWIGQPARWLGSTASEVARWRTPEQQALEAGTVIAWIVAFGLALWWLWRVRIHNRWREYAPASRLGLWQEYLWGALFFGLLLAPGLLLGTAYSHRVRHLWQGHDVVAQQQAARYVRLWEQLLTPGNAARLAEWADAAQTTPAIPQAVRPAQDDESDEDAEDAPCHATQAVGPGCTADPQQALRWLAQGDAKAIGAQLAQYGAALGAWGYTAAQPAQEQAQALIGAYQAALQSPLAREWQAYKARNPAPPPPAERAQLVRECQAPAPHDPRACFPSDLARTPAQWSENLRETMTRYRSHTPPRFVRWTHPRYGTALPGLVEHHLQGATTSDATRRRLHASLLNTASAGFFVALALVAARLLSLRQIAALCAGLTLSAPLLVLLGMLGLADSVTLPLVPAALLALAWVRIALLRRPWGGSTLLGLGMALALPGFASLWSEAAQALPADPGNAKYWLTLLLGAPAIAASTAVLVAVISPLARRWRALPER